MKSTVRSNRWVNQLLSIRFGVLKFKGMGEQALMDSGLPFTILRPGRLTDGPYTSYDVNTLLKATSGTRRAVDIGGVDIFGFFGGLFFLNYQYGTSINSCTYWHYSTSSTCTVLRTLLESHKTDPAGMLTVTK